MSSRSQFETNENAAGSAANKAQADLELVQRAAKGDMEAFEQIYWSHHRGVYMTCLKIIKDPARAEDLTQQVFINLYRKMDTFRGEAKLSTWLHRTAVNQALMLIRSQRAMKEDLTENGDVPEPAADNSETQMTRQIYRPMLEAAISSLPRGYRRIFVLHDVEGYQHDEIAQMLGCSSGTTKSQLYKARRKLRTLLRTKLIPPTPRPAKA